MQFGCTVKWSIEFEDIFTEKYYIPSGSYVLVFPNWYLIFLTTNVYLFVCIMGFLDFWFSIYTKLCSDY